MAKLSPFITQSLNEQGFSNLNNEAKSHYVWSLRFTPFVGSSLVLMGLIWQSPVILVTMALVALSGVLFPHGMAIDLIYNLAVRHLFHAPPLPPTPKPRQFSYLISTILLTSSALAFHYGLKVLGFILGGLVVLGGTLLATTLWCLGSWCYKRIF